MNRGLFLNISAVGHVTPTLGIVESLIEKGDEIYYYEVTYFKNEVEKIGARFLEYPPLETYPMASTTNPLNLAPVLTWIAKQYLPKILPVVRDLNPDYLVHDSLCLWGRWVGEILGIPSVNSISTAAFHPMSFYFSPVFSKKLPKLWWEARKPLQQFKAWEKELRTRYRTSKTSVLKTFTNSQSLNLCYLPMELQPFGKHFPKKFHFVGPCPLYQKSEKDFPWHKLNGRPIIYISFGTLHDPGKDFYLMCLTTLKGLQYQTVMVAPSYHGLEKEVQPDDSVLIVSTGCAPQLALLGKASLFVSHAAGGAIREAALYGVPILAIPQTLEQEFLAHQLIRRGMGIFLPQPKANPTTLREALDAMVTQPHYRICSKNMQKACLAAGGTSKAVQLIHTWLSERI